MQILIDIPENELTEDEIQECIRIAEVNFSNVTLIKEPHGDLIDRDYLRNVILLHNFHANNKNIVPYADRKGYRQRNREVDEGIINAPTIIEATKGGEK